MSTGCEFYTDALVELARGDLEPERVDRVEAHLAECRDCRETLEAIRLVQGAPAPMPEDLETRIREAVRGDATERSVRVEAPTIRLAPRRRWSGWRAWSLPLAAAAALVIWLGAENILAPGNGTSEPTTTEAAVAEYDPYGAWPASDGVVAGDMVLSELSVDELEALLEEMQ